VVATNLEFVRAVGLQPPGPVTCDGSWLLEQVGDRCPTGPWSPAPVAVLLPGTGGKHKVLPESTLAAVGRGLHDLGLEPVVAWGPGERERAQLVAERAGAHLAPPTNLEELAALLGSAALVVGGDTGPTHLAASFNVPTIAVFLASDWRRNGPLGARTQVVSGARTGRPVPSGSARTGVARSVSADEILAAARDLLT
jgi:ADP-heptose:LPS heptosyltransferase